MSYLHHSDRKVSIMEFVPRNGVLNLNSLHPVADASLLHGDEIPTYLKIQKGIYAPDCLRLWRWGNNWRDQMLGLLYLVSRSSRRASYPNPYFGTLSFLAGEGQPGTTSTFADISASLKEIRVPTVFEESSCLASVQKVSLPCQQFFQLFTGI